MIRPAVAIIGRPNVGKSTLFNCIVGRRIAIEDPTAGVTRDRLLHPVRAGDTLFDLIDTGGIGMVDRQDLTADVETQINLAIDAADLLVFLADCREGVTPLDLTITERLRKLKKPFLFAVNKADTAELAGEAVAFYELGLGDPIVLSAQQNRGVDELLKRVAAKLPPAPPGASVDEEILKIAIVGKRNAGKSSLINRLAGAERVIVSATPGTTRDAVDVLFERDDNRFLAIDTAGLRRRGQMDDAIEFYGQIRSERAIRRADVTAFLIDASVPVSKVDKRIAQLVMEESVPCVLVINKWDLAVAARPEITSADYHEYLKKSLTGLWFAPLVCTSALTGKNVWGVITVARDLHAQASKTVTTGELNRALQEAQERRRPKRVRNRQLKIYYGTQTGTRPPTFLVFVNDPGLVDEPYTRYLANQLRQSLGLTEVPVRIEYRSSHG